MRFKTFHSHPAEGVVSRLLSSLRFTTRTWSPSDRWLAGICAVVPLALGLRFLVPYLIRQFGRLGVGLVVGVLAGTVCPVSASISGWLGFSLAGLWLWWLASGTGRFTNPGKATLLAMVLLVILRETVLTQIILEMQP
jgi:hypothetical protein